MEQHANEKDTAMTALGFIETHGLLAAIEGADAMLKAAQVRLVEKNCVGGGLVSITVAGEVAAVQAAVDAADTAIRGIKGATLVSRHVIARPDSELAGIIATGITRSQTGTQVLPEPARLCADKAAVAARRETPGAPEEPERARHGISELKLMNVSRLRQLARTLGRVHMTCEAIESARKKDLIEAIITAYRQEEE
jgi:microcompartment protein CcmL/EutN